tara:strand:- start:164 stop:631 length:468 start_codon:yes stop_codon:yes gene_type:complete
MDSLVLANLNVLRVAREHEYDGVRIKTYRSSAFEKTIQNILELRKEKSNLTFDDLDNARVGGDRMMLYIERMDFSKDDLPEVKRLLTDPHRGYIVHYAEYNKPPDVELQNIKDDIKEYMVLVSGIILWLFRQATTGVVRLWSVVKIWCCEKIYVK